MTKSLSDLLGNDFTDEIITKSGLQEQIHKTALEVITKIFQNALDNILVQAKIDENSDEIFIELNLATEECEIELTKSFALKKLLEGDCGIYDALWCEEEAASKSAEFFRQAAEKCLQSGKGLDS